MSSTADHTRPSVPLVEAAPLAAECDRVLAVARERLTELESSTSILAEWDDLEIFLEDLGGPASLLSSVHPDRAVRDAADQVVLQITSFSTEMFQNEALYARVRSAVPADEVERKLQQDLIEGFEDAGVTLPPPQRARAKEISDRVTDLAQQFERNIRDNGEQLAMEAHELNGVPSSLVERLPRDGQGRYLLGLDAPLFTPVITYADLEETRRRYYVAYQNRGTAANVALLDEIVRLRGEIAELYGVPSYAHYIAKRRMAESPERIHEFLENVGRVVESAERRDVEQLRAERARIDGTPLDQTRIERWDVAYYSEKLRSRLYAIDQEALRKYFPPGPTLQWLIGVTSELYGVRFERVQHPVWHEEVECYELFATPGGDYVGAVYLDLYPREGKFKHAAAWPVRGVSTRAGRTPISVLVTNFDRSGFTHGEVETLFHEFGHVMHGVLSRTRFNHHSGTSVQRDFVEAPSQMYEAWARRTETLSRIRQHCSDCPIMDEEMIGRLEAARQFGSGIKYARQHLYASFDMALSSATPQPALEVWRAMEGATLLGHVPGTEFPGAFGHIASGYAAGYYGYMWSEVIALDMLSVFGADLMNREAGGRFRDSILARGSERPARELVESFLGREVSNRAFFEMLEGTGRPSL